MIFLGENNEYFAVKKRKTMFFVVIYKEDKNKTDGFIITAFMTSNINYLLRKKTIWKKK
ncbi:MAG: hypothetical protein Q7R95_01665 [bacterium]|nr:hypothetical protein [bacterium]